MRIWPPLLATLAITSLLTVAQVAAGAATNPNSPASEVVANLQSALLDVMKQGTKLDLQARYQKLAPTIARAYDFAYITPRVFGDAWQRLPDAQKQTIADLYQRASTMMYAREFSDYHGEQFVILDDQPSARGGRVVRSEMRVPHAPAVHFDYLLHQNDGRWSIINTNFDGVSGLSMDRSRYEPLLRERGPDALIAQLRQAADAGAPARE